MKKEWEWQHYTGWRISGDLNDSGVRLGIGVLRDKKTGVLCTTSGYPGYPACPSQEYLLTAGQHRALDRLRLRNLYRI